MHLLWLARSATVTRSGIKNLTEMLTVHDQELAQSLKHAFKTRPIRTRCTRYSYSTKRDSYPTCTVSNTELLTTKNVGTIIKTRI